MKVAVLGAATSRFGELWDVSPRKLVGEIVKEAVFSSNLALVDIEAIYVGNMLSGILGNQENLGAYIADELGVKIPAFKIEGACASGGLAVHIGALSILSGIYKKVLIVGVEKMTDHSLEDVSAGLMGAGSDEERSAGLTFPGLYALMANAYLREYATTEIEMAAVAVKNHYHASLNPKAHFRLKVTIDQVLKSAKVADPLKLLDCSPISDGVAAVVLADAATAQKKHKKPIWITSSSVATDSLALAGRKSLTSINAAVSASQKAYSQAGTTPSNIDIVEVHDCFTIAEIIALEDLGFYEKGKAGKAILNEELTLGKAKKLVVNTSGGLKACGHPIGATGVKQVVEITEQLRGIAGIRQVEDAKIGLTHNVGGSGAVAVIHILKI